VCSVSVCDVRVLLQKPWDLLIGVQADPSGHEHRPVLVAAQLDVMGALERVLRHLGSSGLRNKADQLQKEKTLLAT